jgi:hypothetical protein
MTENDKDKLAVLVRLSGRQAQYVEQTAERLNVSRSDVLRLAVAEAEAQEAKKYSRG